MKRRLNHILSIAQDIIEKSDASKDFNHPIYRYINAIGSVVLNNLMMQLFTGQEVSNASYLLDDLLFSCDNCLTLDENSTLSIDLKDNLVIPVAWNKDRFIDNLISIGSDCGKPFKFHSINHMGTVFLPIGVTIVYNGNHSILTGILKREGSISPRQVINLAFLYDRIKFDGMSYRDIKNNSLIQKVNYFELGAIFEIGRLLVQNNFNQE